eukprot:1902257-Rhodomonas_salina.1
MYSAAITRIMRMHTQQVEYVSTVTTTGVCTGLGGSERRRAMRRAEREERGSGRRVKGKERGEGGARGGGDQAGAVCVRNHHSKSCGRAGEQGRAALEPTRRRSTGGTGPWRGRAGSATDPQLVGA